MANDAAFTVLRGPGYAVPNKRLQRIGTSIPPVNNLRLAHTDEGIQQPFNAARQRPGDNW
jgi:hypothetical protein